MLRLASKDVLADSASNGIDLTSPYPSRASTGEPHSAQLIRNEAGVRGLKVPASPAWIWSLLLISGLLIVAWNVSQQQNQAPSTAIRIPE